MSRSPGAPAAAAKVPGERLVRDGAWEPDGAAVDARNMQVDGLVSPPGSHSPATEENSNGMMTQLLRAVKTHRPFDAGPREMLVWEKIRADVNLEAERELIPNRVKCRQDVMQLLGAYKARHRAVYWKLTAEQIQLLEAISAPNATAPRECATTGQAREKPHAELILESDRRMKQYLDDKLRTMLTEQSNVTKQCVEAQAQATREEVKDLAKGIERVLEGIQTLQETNVQAETTPHRKLDDRVNQRSEDKAQPNTANPEVGTLDLEKDTQMIRAFLDGAFWIGQSTGRIHELLTRIEEQLPPERTRVARRIAAAERSQTQETDTSASGLPAYPSEENKTQRHDRSKKRLSYSTLLLRSIEANRPSKAGACEMTVWEKIRADVNSQMRFEVFKSREACRRIAVGLLRVYKKREPTMYAKFSAELRLLLNDGALEHQTERERDRDTGAPEAAMNAIACQDIRGKGASSAVSRDSQVQARSSIVAQSSSDQQPVVTTILRCERRMKQYMDEKLRGMVPEEVVKQYLDTRLLESNVKITSLVGTIEHVREEVQSRLAAMESKVQAVDIAGTKIPERMSQRFATAAQVFGDDGGEPRTNEAVGGMAPQPVSSIRLPPISVWHHERPHDVDPPRIAKKARFYA